MVVPEGTLGSRFDAVARSALWKLGLDYNHGTGHGVGAFLNVHEGPQGIGFRPRDNEAVSIYSRLYMLIGII
jgi:Xaa-Pro aminopeptidase